jgi:CRP/FNR family transcriptional regulator, cyclic AMP receptor protein
VAPCQPRYVYRRPPANPSAARRSRPRAALALPEVAADRLLEEAPLITVPAGVSLHRGGEQPRVIVVLRGLLRVFLSSEDGRQVTVRYAHSGDVVGLVLVLGGPGPTSIEALTTASALALCVGTCA